MTLSIAHRALYFVFVFIGSNAWSATDPTVSSESAVPLSKNLGTLQFQITTSSPQAQDYFNQGLRLTFGFNHEEARLAFEQAAKVDPHCAMCYWGAALVLGPNINLPMDPANESRAHELAQKALAAAAVPNSAITAKELALIEAITKRYGENSSIDREHRNDSYAKAMRTVANRYFEDSTIQSLFAESLMDLSPWDYWTREGEPKKYTNELVAALERAIELDENHPGACHYYIHAVEASLEPDRALECARKLPGLMPGAGHLVHMPAHIYMRLGMYDEAIEANQNASHVDHRYIQDRRPKGFYPLLYYPHNLHFLYAANAMAGRSADAILAAREVIANVSPDAVAQNPALELFTPTLYFALTRFGRWDDLLKEPGPPDTFKYTNGVWHFARGLAFTAKNDIPKATRERNQLRAIVLEMGENVVIGLNRGKSLLEIADNVLTAEMLAREKKFEDAVVVLDKAITQEEALIYDEPPAWFQPVRQVKGAILIAADRPLDAEQAYREDLVRNPNNGWSLFGLLASLKAQKKIQDIATMEQRFRRAWQNADVTLTASRF